ncbi:hypothetical protein FJY68_02630 [candidate division WOR-3 bacterium]|uniref:Uncharacterized protein n=1 Tax=candidate division WOR-3 bacterium TaxID=2052148 RepID=A0A938BSM8_UNCW3|nr:hypothetical protein [candidate division WOR-3 bacterium]
MKVRVLSQRLLRDARGLAGRSVGAAVRRHLADDRGVAALEAVLVLLFIAGVLLGIVLLGQWGTHLQYSQMGARLLAFDAGDETLAKSGRAGDSAIQTFSISSWDPYGGSLPVGWLNVMFVLPNQRFCGRVSGVQSGRLLGQSPVAVPRYRLLRRALPYRPRGPRFCSVDPARNPAGRDHPRSRGRGQIGPGNPRDPADAAMTGDRLGRRYETRPEQTATAQHPPTHQDTA